MIACGARVGAGASGAAHAAAYNGHAALVRFLVDGAGASVEDEVRKAVQGLALSQIVEQTVWDTTGNTASQTAGGPKFDPLKKPATTSAITKMTLSAIASAKALLASPLLGGDG